MSTTVGVAIPSIPPRKGMLTRALTSVVNQTWPPDQISVAIDHQGKGAAATRNRALDAINTEWVAFLDDDDEFLPQHLERLVTYAQYHDADFIYPWYEGINTKAFHVPDENGDLADPFLVPWHSGMERYLRNAGNFIPVTVMVKTELIKRVGGFETMGSSTGMQGEDYVAWLKLLDAGATFVHLAERTWRWNGHGGHTSGRVWKDLQQADGSFSHF